MRPFHLQSAAEQVAGHLAELIEAGEWREKIPGVKHLTAELGVNHKTVQAALELLEKQGLLLNQGLRRRRRINGAVVRGDAKECRGLRVGILGYEPSDRVAPDSLDLLHGLEQKGHAVDFAPRTLTELGHRVDQVAAMIEGLPADAWVVMAGGRDVLGWFAEQAVPVFAYCGRAQRLAIASVAPDKAGPLREAVRRLVALGHRRIVMLVREERRKPEPGHTERAFLDELGACGISTGSFNLPDWKEDVAGFHQRLETLFGFTPPTALIVDQEPFAAAVLQFCLKRSFQVPRDLSLMCTDPCPAFEWFQPALAHIAWEHRPLVQRILRWVENVSAGREDRRKSFSKASFVEGGTIGPARRG